MVRAPKKLIDIDRAIQPLQGPGALDQLRRHFLELMDQVAAELCRRGMDFDDCVLERIAWLANPESDEVLEFPVLGVADARAVLGAAPLPTVVLNEENARALLVRIQRLGVRAVVDSGAPI